ncbi:MAG TPA: hypothetical protein ENJ35_08980 [Gammaproteobacteria bacterium]|nr:hypothetical protein [Gammaproteobacteria bacterium]
MSPSFSTLYLALQQWTTEAVEAGWLKRDALTQVESIEQQQVGELFRQHPHRPLIVGLFGGTGVGKSSLLNRLAGEKIARAGVERPTSHEVTLYLHKDFQLDLLPADLPTQETRIAYHSRPERRLIAWLDMPDIDSTATHNQEIVKTWLPYVDWIIYVVSPERYYDDIGWRFLQQRAQRHAWIFVMNHWDQGREEQIEDFRRRLQTEGFKDPLILRTIGVQTDQPDDFDKLEEIINNAINRYGLDILQQLGIQARNEDLQQLASRFAHELKDNDRWAEAEKDWQQTVNAHIDRIVEHLDTQVEALTQTLLASEAGKKRGLLARLKESDEIEQPAPGAPDKLIAALWDQRNIDRLKMLNEQLLNQLQEHNLPYKAFEPTLDALVKKAGTQVEQALADGMTASLAKPGNGLQRFLYRFSGALSWLLPFLAASWAVYHVVVTFYSGTQGEQHFLGINFLIHSAMLILLGALLPWLIHIKLKPSITATMRRGLKNGVQSTATRLKQIWQDGWKERMQNRKHRYHELEEIREDIKQLEAEPLKELGGIMQSRELK